MFLSTPEWQFVTQTMIRISHTPRRSLSRFRSGSDPTTRLRWSYNVPREAPESIDNGETVVAKSSSCASAAF